MESTETVFGKHRTFTASQQNMVIVGAKSKYIEGIAVTMNSLQNTTTAITIAAQLGNVNPLAVDVGGTNEINTRGVDLYALDLLGFGINPVTKIGAGDNQENIVSGLWLPCWFPPTSEETKISATFVAITNGDTSELTVTAHFLDGLPRRETLHYTEFAVNTSGVDNTSLNNWTHTVDLIGDCIGILMFATTVAGGSVLMEDGTFQQIAVDVEGIEKLNYEWHEIPAIPRIFGGQQYEALRDSPADLTIIDNYRFLPIMREAVPAASQMKIRAMAGVDAEAGRDLVLQSIRF